MTLQPSRFPLPNDYQDILAGRRRAKGVTIDQPEARELDDAIWVEKKDGGYRVEVSIADVAALVPPGSSLDKDALEKCETFELRLAKKSMLPHWLSEGQLSLLEKQMRPTISITIDLDEALNISNINIERTRLSSSKRYDYGEATQETKMPGTHLHLASELALKLLQKRGEGNAKIFFDQETGVYSSGDGEPQMLGEDAPAHILVQEMMILANRSAAQFMRERGAPFLYRNDLGAPARALYEPEARGHKRLDAECYTHFTSPIRRYPDLVAQRLAMAHIQQLPPPYSPEELISITQRINDTFERHREEKHKFLRECANEETARMVTSPTFEGLSNHQLEMSLKLLAHSDNMPDELLKYAYARIRGNTCHVRHFHIIMMQGDSALDPRWDVLKDAVFAMLEARPERAQELLKEGREQHSYNDYGYAVSPVGMAYKQTFYARAYIVDASGIRWSAPQTAAGKDQQTAEKIAAMDFWRAYKAKALVPAEAAVKTETPSRAGSRASRRGGSISQNNAIALLEDLSRQHKFDMHFDTRTTGPVYAQETSCKLTITGPQWAMPLMVTANVEGNKDLANRKAAETMLNLHGFSSKIRYNEAEPANMVRNSPILQIIDLERQKQWKTHYSFSSTGTDQELLHHVHLDISAPSGEGFSVDAQAPDKAVAKTLAAKAALEHPVAAELLERYRQADGRLY